MAGSGWWARVRTAPAVSVVVLIAIVSSVLALGEPNRPATATTVRPIVTVPALCSVPTIVDVAAREATRGLTAVGQLLGIDEELVGPAARDLHVVDTEAGTFFVLVRAGELRVAALSPAGLPIVNTEGATPRTHRAFVLDDALAERPPLVVNGRDGVFVVLGGADEPVQVLALTPSTLAGSTELRLASGDAAPEIADPRSRPGSAVVLDGVLWLAGDDGRVVTFDPYAEDTRRWNTQAEGAIAPLLARGDGSVLAVFASSSDGAAVELRSFPADGEPQVLPVDAAVRSVTATTYPGSALPAFAVVTDEGAGLLRPGTGSASPAPVTPVAGTAGDLLGIVATTSATALSMVERGELLYRVVDAAGAELGRVTAATDERCTDGPWPDAASTVRPGSAGRLLHLHDPSAPRDCVVDTADPEGLADLTTRCAAGGDWSVDKGSAPARDFTVEIGRALDEVEADQLEEDARPEDDSTSSADAIQEELGSSGIEVVETEVDTDADAADRCAAEEVDALGPPVLDLAEPVGARALRVEWTWRGGECLPGRYVVTHCLLAETGSGCTDATETEVVADPESARSVVELDARPDRTYRVTVTAWKGEVASAPSGALLVTTPMSTPDPPVEVSASLAAGAWQLAWSSCLAGGDCEQRPDGFAVSVEGCDGDGLGQVTRRFDASTQGTSFGADGAGFGGLDLLGRHVRFRVATTAGGRTSEPVDAGACTASVRPGRDGAAADVGASLTGRAREVTLAGLTDGPQLRSLFGTRDYTGVDARLRRGGSVFPGEGDALGGGVRFTVDRCAEDGWTIELMPRASGRSLPEHRSFLTSAVVACDPSIDDSTRIAVATTGAGSDGIDLRVTIPDLGQDVTNGLVDDVTGTATCATAFGGEDVRTLSDGAIEGDRVSFRMPVPAVLDLRDGCRIRVTVGFAGGGSATPPARGVNLDAAARRIVEVVARAASDRVDRARTGRYEGPRTNVSGLGGERDVVAVRHDGSGMPCDGTFGSTRWRFEVRGTATTGCEGGAHVVVYGSEELDGRGDARIAVRASIVGITAVRASVTRTVAICDLPSGAPQPPCEPEPPPCVFDDTLPADDPACPDPCPADPSLPLDHPGCVPPPPCETDPSLPADDPDCPDPVDPPPDDDPGDDPDDDPDNDPDAAAVPDPVPDTAADPAFAALHGSGGS